MNPQQMTDAELCRHTLTVLRTLPSKRSEYEACIAEIEARGMERWEAALQAESARRQESNGLERRRYDVVGGPVEAMALQAATLEELEGNDVPEKCPGNGEDYCDSERETYCAHHAAELARFLAETPF